MNSFILVHKLYIQRKVAKKYYLFVKEKTSDLNLSYVDLTKILEPLHIYLRNYEEEDSAFGVMKSIEEHIEIRFNELEDKLLLDSRVQITFPGKNALKNDMLPIEVENVWRGFDKENFTRIITRLKKLIIVRIQLLQKKFYGRIKFGSVSDKDASEISYQVWPADMRNWDLPENSQMVGEGYSLYFDYQIPGVFGIVTNPRYGYRF